MGKATARAPYAANDLRNRKTNLFLLEMSTISVLMPVYNTRLQWLEKAIHSIQMQTVTDFDFVIVDDGSTDIDVRAVLHRVNKADTRVKLVTTKENRGIASALNSGLKHCKGDLVVRMDSDDIAHPNLLEYHLQFFAQHPDAVVCGIKMNCFNDRNFVTRHADIITIDHAISKTNQWLLNHPGVCYKREVVLEVGGYGKVKQGFAEDYYLWCKLLKAGYILHNNQVIAMDYRLQIKKSRPEGYLEFLEKCKSTLYE
jgi:glycosyltransferase involved in cell wall biosynthesis